MLSVILFQFTSILLKCQRVVFKFYKSFHHISFLLLPIKTASFIFSIISAYYLLHFYYCSFIIIFNEIIIIMLFYKHNKNIKKV
jgi:hypothetical protein